MTIEIVPATDDEVARFFRGIHFKTNWIGRAIRKGKLVAAMGGVMEIEPGVWFAFLDVPAHLRRPSIYRHVLSVLDDVKSQGAAVIRATCDTDVPRAEALLQRLGFEPTDEVVDDKRVWAWQL